MQKLNVKCPKCQKQFGINNHSDKTELKVNCPYCQYLLTVVVKRKPIRLDMNTPITAPPSGIISQMHQASQLKPQSQLASLQPAQPVAPQPARSMASPQPGGGHTILPEDYMRGGGAAPGGGHTILPEDYMRGGGAAPGGGHTILPEDYLRQQRAAAARGMQPGETVPYSGSPVRGTRPVLVFAGVSYPLAVGINTVGRRGQTSQASIQLPTTDMCMSRVNATFDVVKLADGSYHVSVSSVNEHNLVQINGHSVPANNRIMLLDGMVLTLGRSTVTFTYQ